MPTTNNVAAQTVIRSCQISLVRYRILENSYYLVEEISAHVSQILHTPEEKAEVMSMQQIVLFFFSLDRSVMDPGFVIQKKKTKKKNSTRYLIGISGIKTWWKNWKLIQTNLFTVWPNIAKPAINQTFMKNHSLEERESRHKR